MKKEIEIGKCQCGCGKNTQTANRNRYLNNWIKGQPKPFLKGHNSKFKKSPEVGEGHKWCSKCDQVKILDAFAKNMGNNKLNKQTLCKECSLYAHREYISKNREKDRRYTQKVRLRQKYGMTPEDYNKMLENQSGLCAICNLPESTIHQGIPRLMAVDHCHTTNKVRSLLCNSCNRVLGMVKENKEILQNMMDYIDHHKT